MKQRSKFAAAASLTTGRHWTHYVVVAYYHEVLQNSSVFGGAACRYVAVNQLALTTGRRWMRHITTMKQCSRFAAAASLTTGEPDHAANPTPYGTGQRGTLCGCLCWHRRFSKVLFTRTAMLLLLWLAVEHCTAT
jgi:hypothetical protein